MSRSCPPYMIRSLSASDRLLFSSPQPPKQCAALVLRTYFCELGRWSWRARGTWLGWWWAGTPSWELLRSGLTGYTPSLRSAADWGFFELHKFISYLKEGVKLQLSLFSWPHRAWKQRTPLIIKCCSVGTTPPPWLLDICHRRSWSASPGWGYVVKEILTRRQTCLTHHGLTDGCCSRTFPLWRITSHIMTGSGLSCSPGSWSCFPRTPLRTKSCSPGSRSFLKGFLFSFAARLQ